MSEDTSELTLGVLGAGRIGRIHAAHMAMHPQVGAVVLLGRDQGRLESALPEILRIAEEAPRPSDQEQVAAKLRPRVLPESAGRVGAYEGLDGLVVAASTEAHGPLITEAVASGIPLLIEKPLAASVEEQLELIRLMESRGIRAMMGYNRRFDDAHRQLRSRVLSGVLGTPRGAVAVNLDYLDADEAFVPLVRGLWRDLAVHDFNALAWIFDDRIVSVSAHSSVAENPMYGRHGDVDTASAVLKFSSGAVATLLCGRRMGWRQETRMEVHGTEGSESTDVAATGSRTHRLDGHEEQGEPFTSAMTRFKESYLNETDEFVRLVLGAESTSPPRQCLAALQVALAAEESVRTGRTVEIA